LSVRSCFDKNIANTVHGNNCSNQRWKTKKARVKSGGRTTRKARAALGIRAAWSEDVMKSAVAAVRQNHMGLNKAATDFGVQVSK